MDPLNTLSQGRSLVEQSLGIWFAAWAFRRRMGWDYKLSGAAQFTRWAVAIAGYSLAGSLGSPAARLISGFIGLGFLCWHNLAYHLTNLFLKRPMIIIPGRVTSVAYDGSRASLGYSFTYGGDRFGGTSCVKRRVSRAHWAPGEPIDVIFDPLNPKKSKVSTL